MAPPNNTKLHAALQRYTANGREQDTLELIQLFGETKCTVMMPVRVTGERGEQTQEFATAHDPELGPVVHVYTMREELPRNKGGIAVLTCTVLDLMGDLLQGADVGVVFDAQASHAVYFRFNGPQWVVRIVARMRGEKRAQAN